MDYLKDIINDIKSGQCVLVIGPDIIDFGESSFFEALSKELTGNESSKNIIDNVPQYIFENEELFQLLTPKMEANLIRLIKDFYQKQNAYDEPLTKISQIPFNLIISLMPDDRLVRLFTSQNLDFSYSYYPKEGTFAQVTIPSNNKPLIYNLLGDFNDKDAVLTFDNLFTFLSHIMDKEKGLPDNLQAVLKKSMTIIFLGVRFDKWHVQLLLRKIAQKGNNQYTIINSVKNNDLCTFVARRLELDFLQTEPIQFLNELYNECGKQEILKTVSTKFKKKIFISYNSKDIQVVKGIEQKFLDSQIDVIRDEVSSSAGQKIEHFIETIRTVDGVLLVVSENSLKSPWVCKEIITTIQNKKRLTPCYIDKSFLNDQFWDELKNIIKNKISEIVNKMNVRGADSIDDLIEERKDWELFNTSLPAIRNELLRGIAKSIMPDDFNINIMQVIQQILNDK